MLIEELKCFANKQQLLHLLQNVAHGSVLWMCDQKTQIVLLATSVGMQLIVKNHQVKNAA
jgi:hypothetical protein